MPFAIIAELPLGTYRGARPDGGLDQIPSPARLHAALLNAAACGARAIHDGDRLRPCPADAAALAWLERNPPDALTVPPVRVNDGVAVAFRAEGFFGKREGVRVEEKRTDRFGSVAFAGPIGWLWQEDPPAEIREALEGLCPDVSHIGTAETPVRLRLGGARATHRRDTAASVFADGGLEVDVPLEGRTRVLQDAHARSSLPGPNRRQDAVASAESALVDPVPRTALGRVRYNVESPPRPDAPWPTVVLLPVDATIPPDRRVGWCVAVHRALVSLIGDGAPALVTGRYETGVRRPPNHLAIQYLPACTPAFPMKGVNGAFILLLPPVAEPAELATVERAVRSLREIRLGRGSPVRLARRTEVLPGDEFWVPPAVGHERLWITAVPAVPESRPPCAASWTIGDAALLSVGLIFRDRFERPPSRRAWYRALRDAVVAAGCEVVEAHKICDPLVGRYIHRATPELTIQPYRAALRLDGLVGNRTLIAIGQSRHLGGGLLVPFDLPEDPASVTAAAGARR
jgi:CRISPR-associated protein Csb2